MTLSLERIRSEEIDTKSSFALYKIISYPADFTLQVLNDKCKDGEIVIPDFQRGFVWSHIQASRLIESFLMGLPVPPLFLYKEDSEKHLVVDGQQRLKSICSFFDGKLPDGRVFRLKGVNSTWNDQTYAQLNERRETDSRRLRNSVLRAVIMQQVDPSDLTSIYHVFERLNTGGTALNSQEVRNCVYHGEFNKFIIRLNTTAGWREILGAPKPDRRMRDVELLLRFSALSEDYKGYTRPMKDFVSAFMKRYQHSTSNQNFQVLFENTVSLVLKGLGSKPFHRRRGLNAAILDSVMVAFATSKRPVPSNIKSRYRKLLKLSEYKETTSQHTTDEDNVKKRIDLALRTLFS